MPTVATGTPHYMISDFYEPAAPSLRDWTLVVSPTFLTARYVLPLIPSAGCGTD